MNSEKNNDAEYVKKEFIDNVYAWMTDEAVDEYVKGVGAIRIKTAFKKIKKNILEEAIIGAMKHLLDLKNFKNSDHPVDAFYYLSGFMKKLGLLPEHSKLEWLFDNNADWMKNALKYTFTENVDLKGSTLKSVLDQLSSEEEKRLKEEQDRLKKEQEEKQREKERLEQERIKKEEERKKLEASSSIDSFANALKTIQSKL